jgi:hypothetical protein
METIIPSQKNACLKDVDAQAQAVGYGKRTSIIETLDGKLLIRCETLSVIENPEARSSRGEVKKIEMKGSSADSTGI